MTALAGWQNFYVIVGSSAGAHLREALLGAGAAVLLLLFVGIHNAWDAVTYHVFARSKDQERDA